MIDALRARAGPRAGASATTTLTVRGTRPRPLRHHRVRHHRAVRRDQGPRLAGRRQGRAVVARRLRPPRRPDHVSGRRGAASGRPCSRSPASSPRSMVRDRPAAGSGSDANLWAGLDPIDYFVATIVQLMAQAGREAQSVTPARPLAASRYGVLAVTKDGRFIQTSTLLPHQGRALVRGRRRSPTALQDERFANLPSFANAEVAQEFEDLLLEAFRAAGPGPLAAASCWPAPTSRSRSPAPARRASTTRRSCTTATSSRSKIRASGRSARSVRSPTSPTLRSAPARSAPGAGRACGPCRARHRGSPTAAARHRSTRSPGSRSSSSATSTRCPTA